MAIPNTIRSSECRPINIINTTFIIFLVVAMPEVPDWVKGLLFHLFMSLNPLILAAPAIVAAGVEAYKFAKKELRKK